MPHRHIASPQLRDAIPSPTLQPRTHDRLSPFATVLLFVAIAAGYALLLGPHLFGHGHDAHRPGLSQDDGFAAPLAGHRHATATPEPPPRD